MDKYDEQIKFLRQNPNHLWDQWQSAKGLFKFAGYMGGTLTDTEVMGFPMGCLTMIRGGNYYAYTKGKPDLQLTKDIQADERLPEFEANITVESLPVFAEWQREIDKLNE